ncbi:MAG: FtsX-like permease family protein [Mariniphaga sp.]
MGIFVIAIYDAQRRTKEIGLRKVNGARIAEIMLLLNKDFFKLVAVAFLIACPFAWYALHKWLQNFAYKTTNSWWIFAVAGAVALIVALLTVSWKRLESRDEKSCGGIVI